MAKIGVLLSGCGVQDGSEIYESVLTLLALSQGHAEAICIAPNMAQKQVVNHISGEEMQEKRSVLIEAARLARGVIEDLDDMQGKDLDGLILPGGFGAAKNLSTFAFDGVDCQVHPEAERLIAEIHEAGKPLGAMCIAPAVVAKVLEGKGLRLTMGSDPKLRQAVEKLGHQFIECETGDICVDEQHNVVTTPAYLTAQSIAGAQEGIGRLVQKILERIQEKV